MAPLHREVGRYGSNTKAAKVCVWRSKSRLRGTSVSAVNGVTLDLEGNLGGVARTLVTGSRILRSWSNENESMGKRQARPFPPRCRP
jgi:hypothetical protein